MVITGTYDNMPQAVCLDDICHIASEMGYNYICAVLRSGNKTALTGTWVINGVSLDTANRDDRKIILDFIINYMVTTQ